MSALKSFEKIHEEVINLKEEGGYSIDDFYKALDIDPSKHEISSLMNWFFKDDQNEWLVQQVIRESIRLGLRDTPIYPHLIADTKVVDKYSVIMPHINMSDNEAETSPVVSIGTKTAELSKPVTINLKLTDEIVNNVTLNLLSVFLKDVGIKLNRAIDTLAINTLINGDQSDDSDKCAAIGVKTKGSFDDLDFLRARTRLSRLGKAPTCIILSENAYLDVYKLPEFKKLPHYVHEAMPEDKVMLVSKNDAMIKLDAFAMTVKYSKYIQHTHIYVHLPKTGFATLFRNGRLILDKSKEFSSQGFPKWF